MPANLKLSLPKGMTPDQANTLLVQAQQALINLLTGQMPSAVETPQLGRVSFVGTTVADLQRYIDYLNGIITSGGATNGSSGMSVRKPFSFFGWP
jgi:hypothetical protein